MNQRDAMKALLDGKSLIYRSVSPRGKALGGVVYLRKDGYLTWSDGRPASLAGHDWQIYEVPNQHAKGTFAWAREEARRGNLVRIGGRHISPFDANDFGEHFSWQIWEIDATDWEVV